MTRPELGFGLRHVALFVRDLAACERFYVDLLGFEVEWRPDPDNLYLSSGGDNLALHRAKSDAGPSAELSSEPVSTGQRLDHIGILLKSAADVDDWYRHLSAHGVTMRSEPKRHRDGATSFYCEDPDGTVVQFIHHLPVCDWEQLKGAN